MKNAKLVKIVQILAQLNGASFASLDTETVVKLKGGKANAMQGRVKKQNTGASIMVFQNKYNNAYSAMVKRRLEKEGKDPETFELKPRQWGERIPETPLVEHNGELYLEVIFLKSGKSTYTLDGKPIIADDIVGLEVQKESEESQAGLKDKVIIRTFKLASVKRLKIGTKEYTENDLKQEG